MRPRAAGGFRWAARWASLGLLVAPAGACRGKGASQAAATPAAVEVGRENIAVATMEQLQSGPPISRTLEARQMATLRAEVAGPVLQTYVDRGQSVRRGQLLARIDASTHTMHMASR